MNDTHTFQISFPSDPLALNVALLPVSFSIPDDRIGYNQEEAAEKCGVSRVTIWRDTKAGLVKCNHRGIYSDEELRRYLRDTQVKNPTAPAAASTGRPRKKRTKL